MYQKETTILTYGARPTVAANALDWAADADFLPLPVEYSLRLIGDLFTTDQFDVVEKHLQAGFFGGGKTL